MAKFAHFFVAFMTIAGAPAALASNEPLPAAADRAVCARAIAPLERAYDIPGELMQAVALAESGRWDEARTEKYAWPWTVTAGEGGGRFFASRAEAIAHIRKLQAEGRRNIDVGCMQINLRHHPRAFDDLEQAFDPEANAAYAAAYLDDLRRETRSWMAAVSRYHSSTPALARGYWQRVNVLWNDARRRANEALRLAQIERYRMERAERGLPANAVAGQWIAVRPSPPRLTTVRPRPLFSGSVIRQPG
jgi:hypothetical protein